MRPLRKSKKGSMQDMMLLLIVVLVLGISTVITKTIFKNIGDTGIFDDAESAKEIKSDIEDNLFPTFDVMFFIIFIGGTLVAGLLAFQIRTHPAFFWVSAIFLTIITWLAAVFSNVWEAVYYHPGLAAGTGNDTMTVLIMNNLPLWIMGFGAAIMFIMYAINNSEGV